MAITTKAIAAGIDRAKVRMRTLEQELNEADSKLGDGDTGSMLANVIDRMSQVPLQADGDVGTAMANLARAAASATGSSLGTLLATGLLAVSKQTRGETVVEWSRLAQLLTAARDAMLARGRASLGDKTVVDAIDAAASGAAAASAGHSIPAAATAAATEALNRMRSAECRIGRARMFAERSRGSDDPGMLAFVRLADALAGDALRS